MAAQELLKWVEACLELQSEIKNEKRTRILFIKDVERMIFCMD